MNMEAQEKAYKEAMDLLTNNPMFNYDPEKVSQFVHRYFSFPREIQCEVSHLLTQFSAHYKFGYKAFIDFYSPYHPYEERPDHPFYDTLAKTDTELRKRRKKAMEELMTIGIVSERKKIKLRLADESVITMHHLCITAIEGSPIIEKIGEAYNSSQKRIKLDGTHFRILDGENVIKDTNLEAGSNTHTFIALLEDNKDTDLTYRQIRKLCNFSDKTLPVTQWIRELGIEDFIEHITPKTIRYTSVLTK